MFRPLPPTSTPGSSTWRWHGVETCIRQNRSSRPYFVTSRMTCSPPSPPYYLQSTRATYITRSSQPLSQRTAYKDVQLEGWCPSALLRQMQQLNEKAAKPFTDAILKSCHAKLLPNAIQLHHQTKPELTQREYRKLADFLMATSKTTQARDPQNTPPPSPCHQHKFITCISTTTSVTTTTYTITSTTCSPYTITSTTCSPYTPTQTYPSYTSTPAHPTSTSIPSFPSSLTTTFPTSTLPTHATLHTTPSSRPYSTTLYHPIPTLTSAQLKDRPPTIKSTTTLTPVNHSNNHLLQYRHLLPHQNGTGRTLNCASITKGPTRNTPTHHYQRLHAKSPSSNNTAAKLATASLSPSQQKPAKLTHTPHHTARTLLWVEDLESDDNFLNSSSEPGFYNL
ncbi:hypothetical protein Pmani_013376 [Petrolisthes manimaculis]|uniref:Uncharacterized protein n=1 Tax=Petrolisthes manimaculis TaxID=1843537 RepID=A0AAE1PWQ4_9EUCA|nr:hypothetical protein Pmani_013376 [Petrolisthes manimaculis]